MSEKDSPNAGERGSSEGIQNQYDWSSTEPSAAVVETTAQAASCDHQELGPLYDSIDPDAFDAILAPPTTKNTDTTTLISFMYAGYSVTVQSNGTVNVSPV
ncbi:HalOD1 output domain-containing protein [Haladaptatus sp. DYF46]|uniref:HalOD1 output domain-containing protein n=1 Tax=Haladaptatus sp. DYF46 TaxID=2886041 RepID=UPI001E44F0B2|nr:HalOD1 output domain-containing protein [Haladaptatus sp. DYF46]